MWLYMMLGHPGPKENCISVSGYRLIECEKPYYVYVIHVRMFQQHYIVEKRYSELLSWHSEVSTKLFQLHTSSDSDIV